ncbi:hypothetical protein TSAR_016264 [Trichomalopsis sarcophagae]|uniref:Nudix hydrolase domain-containing protein n=1 Tax=Trichomalopsis sarcophagae TaxID=543379 RepID=A0A232F570_9HYME|nr:hypothetical protein TSAR_016264 [Trichomalopsis sarcophagae]
MKAWRESASYDYDLLFLKRHDKANFAGAYVFPGGMIESADADIKWKRLYKNYGYDDNSFKTLIPNSKNRPKIFHSNDNELIREISLRISAIRETFEECGILLCNNCSKSASSSEITSFYVANDELTSWQKKVHSDPNEFYNMCEKLDCYPNLWALHEWANWLTPTFFPASSRFDAAFFFTCLSEIPISKHDDGEINEIVWATPGDATKLKRSLPPPQLYELSTIAKYKSLDNLTQFAIERGKKGAELYLPVRVNLSDGAVHLLPGDSMYPEKVELYEFQILDKSPLTIEEFQNQSPQVHNRTEFTSKL